MKEAGIQVGYPAADLRTGCTQCRLFPAPKEDLFDAPALTPPKTRPATPGNASPPVLVLDADFDFRDLIKPVPKPLQPVRKPAASRRGKTKPRPIQDQMLTAEQREELAKRMKGAAAPKATSA